VAQEALGQRRPATGCSQVYSKQVVGVVQAVARISAGRGTPSSPLVQAGSVLMACVAA
jgi:hypothetical protein